MIFNGATEKAVQLIRKTLNNCLLKSGGVLTGNLSLGSNAEKVKRVLGFYNSEREVSEILGTDGTFYAYDHTNSKTIYGSTKDGVNTFYGEASECLPLEGGTISAARTTLLELNSNTDQNPQAWMSFSHKGSKLGFIGFNRDSDFQLSKDGVSFTTLLHTGNKPAGSYVGNGSATSRTIDIGGFYTNVLLIIGNGCFTFVIGTVARVITESGIRNITTGVSLSGATLTLTTTDTALNANGTSYQYRSI